MDDGTQRRPEGYYWVVKRSGGMGREIAYYRPLLIPWPPQEKIWIWEVLAGGERGWDDESFESIEGPIAELGLIKPKAKG